MFVGSAPAVLGVLDVGKAGGVSVGADVGREVSVGGIGVGDGMAACVCATIVRAPASAVCCTSTGFAVGTAFGAHALASKTNTRPMTKTFRFIC